MRNSGWVKLHRVIFNSSLWMLRPEDFKVAMALVALANTEDKEWLNKWEQRRIVVKRGELITSLSHLATACYLSIRNIRTSLGNLINDGFLEIIEGSRGDTGLTQQNKRNFTHIKILKYDEYQKNRENQNSDNESENHENPHSTDAQTDTAPDSKLTTTKEERNKEERTKKEEKDREPLSESEAPSFLSKELELFKEVAGYVPDDHAVRVNIEYCVQRTTKERMITALTAWKFKGYKPSNLDWLAHWAINGIPKNKKNEQNIPRVTRESREILDWFNRRYEKNFSADSYHTLINELINRGFSVEQIKYSIDYRFDELYEPEEIGKYFKPSVLFKLENFEGYYNAAYKTTWNE